MYMYIIVKLYKHFQYIIDSALFSVLICIGTIGLYGVYMECIRFSNIIHE